MMETAIQLAIAFVVRLCLIVYGEWQDRTMAVKYTDVDYFVFHDAAAFVSEGKSPYLRATYRYTPLLSWLLQPNILISTAFGKVFFISLDVYTGFLIYQILAVRKDVSANTLKFCAAFWLFNPLPIAVSSRGNAESIMSSLVLLLLKMLASHRTSLAGTVFGLAVHFKIYPVTYALPVYFLLGRHEEKGCNGYKELISRLVLPTKERALFIFSSALTFVLLTAGFYCIYGWEFLEHTYLYHLSRKDTRHNFSLYFYMLYLHSGRDNSAVVGLLTFIPQMILLLVFSLKFYKDPGFVFFLHTFAFVTFNKVCTSQYFLWYLCLLPLLLPNLRRISVRKVLVLVLLWFAGQGLWLYPAYLLEFQGQNTFLYIWLAGLLFFSINCYIIYEIIDNYSYVPDIDSCEKHVPNTESKTSFTTSSRRKMVQNTGKGERQQKRLDGCKEKSFTSQSKDSRIPRFTRSQTKEIERK